MTTEYYQLLSSNVSDHKKDFGDNIDLFDKIEVIGKGSQSVVLDTESYVEKQSSIYEFNNLNCILHCPVVNLKIYSPVITGDKIRFYSKKIKKVKMKKTQYLKEIIKDLRKLHDCHIAYNDLCEDNVISGKLIDPGLMNYEGTPLHKARLNLLNDESKPISSKLNDIHAFKILAKNLFWIDLKGTTLEELEKEVDKTWPLENIIQNICIISLVFATLLTLIAGVFNYVVRYKTMKTGDDGKTVFLEYDAELKVILENVSTFSWVSLSLFLLSILFGFLSTVYDKYYKI